MDFHLFVLGWASLSTVLAAGGTIACDTIMRQRYRPTFAMATTVSGVAALCLVALVCFHHAFTNQTTAMIAVTILMVTVLSQKAIDKLNIEEQEAGLMSKWGTWWDGLSDNYLTNKTDFAMSYVVVFVLVGALGYLAINAHAADAIIFDLDQKVGAMTPGSAVATTAKYEQSTSSRVQEYHSASSTPSASHTHTHATHTAHATHAAKTHHDQQ